MLGDIRRTFRNLARRPGFFLAVVLTLTLGIGANSAIFSVIDAVLLRPLPYPAGDRLMAIFESNPRQKMERQSVAPVRLAEWDRLNRSFSGLTGAYTESLAETAGALPEKLVSAKVANRFFTVLGTPLVLGRGFSADEERTNGPQAAVISERFWERRFGRDPQVLGKTLRAGRGSYPIVGVAPDSFRFPVDDVEIWLPAKPSDAVMRLREARFYTSVGRLKDGVAMSAAHADLAAVQGRLAMASRERRTLDGAGGTAEREYRGRRAPQPVDAVRGGVAGARDRMHQCRVPAVGAVEPEGARDRGTLFAGRGTRSRSGAVAARSIVRGGSGGDVGARRRGARGRSGDLRRGASVVDPGGRGRDLDSGTEGDSGGPGDRPA